KRSFIILSFIISFILWIPLRVLNFLFYPSKKMQNPPKKILIQDGYLLGDTLQYSHTLAALRTAFTNSEVHLITRQSACEFLCASGWVHGFVPFSPPWLFKQPFVRSVRAVYACVRRIRGQRFDMAIDLVGDIRGLAFLLACNIPRRISFSDFGGGPWCTNAYATPENCRHLTARWSHLVHCITGRDAEPCAKPLWPALTKETIPVPGPAAGRRLVLVHPGTFNPEKQWPAEKFAQVIDRLMAQEKLETRIICGKDDAPVSDAIVSRLKAPCRIVFPTFGELELLLKQACVLLCLDSFAQHAAAALGTPIVAVYGPSRPQFFAPCADNITVVWNNGEIKPPYRECTGPRPVAANSSDTVFNAVVRTAQSNKE
ncbi:MAG TPA: glycosyltransferase family 9 protein, partial [Chitinivibrionales bacterium]|nr:glycosyltransferase family 9 protein [Chitinivibrionales bacterium]